MNIFLHIVPIKKIVQFRELNWNKLINLNMKGYIQFQLGASSVHQIFTLFGTGPQILVLDQQVCVLGGQILSVDEQSFVVKYVLV